MDELGIAAPSCGLGPGPNLAGRWGQGRRGEKLGVDSNMNQWGERRA